MAASRAGSGQRVGACTSGTYPAGRLHGSCTTPLAGPTRASPVFVMMALTRHSRPATLWLQILLAGGLACVLIILVQTYRLQRSNWSVVERALRDYSTFPAGGYGQHV